MLSEFATRLPEIIFHLRVAALLGGALELKEAERLRAEAIVEELQVQGAKQVNHQRKRAPSCWLLFGWPTPKRVCLQLFQEPRPLDNDLLFGNFNVAFVSTTEAPRQNGQRKSHGVGEPESLSSISLS